MPLHILQLGPYPPPEGGVSRNMLAIRDAALRHGHTCTIIATAKSSRQDGAENVHHPESAIGLLRLLASLKYDVAHLHVGGDISARVMALALAVSTFGRGRCVLTIHSGAFPQSEAARAAKPLSIRGLIFRRFSRIIAVNEPIGEVFRRYGVADEKVSVILPYALAIPDPEVRLDANLVEFAEQHSPLLLSVGGLEKDYEPLFQIAAMKAILNEYSNAGLLLVGDGSMRRDVDTAVAESGCSDNILVAGNVAHEQVLHLMDRADVLLRTTLFDGDAISVREALHLGTPVIATDNRMRPEGVELIKVGDESGLVTKLSRVVSNGKKRTASPNSDNENIDAVLKIYEEFA